MEPHPSASKPASGESRLHGHLDDGVVETLRHAHALTAGHDFNHAFESVGVRVRVDVVTLAVVAVADDFQVALSCSTTTGCDPSCVRLNAPCPA